MLDLSQLNELGVEKVQSWIIKKNERLVNYDKHYLYQIKIWLQKKKKINSDSYCILCRILSVKKVDQMGVNLSKNQKVMFVKHGRIENDLLVFDTVKIEKFNLFSFLVRKNKKRKFEPLLDNWKPLFK